MDQSTARTFRFVFSYPGTDLEVISQDRIEMLAPGSDGLDERMGERPQSGLWVELHDEYV